MNRNSSAASHRERGQPFWTVLPRNFWFLLTAVGGVCVVALGVVWRPWLTIGALIFLLFIFASWNRLSVVLPKLFLVSSGVLLAGYAILGRGFAHLGAPPFYIGEAVLALGIVTIILGGGRIGPVFRSPTSWFLVAFMFWGGLRTLPFLNRYGVEALRDGATWGYGVFAILIPALVLRAGCFERSLLAYRRMLPWALISIPLLVLVVRIGGVRLPVPGTSGVNLTDLRTGPMAVHLAGIAVFMALGLHVLDRHRGFLGLKEWFWWTAWLVGFLLAATNNRGGMLSVMLSVFIVIALRPLSTRLGKVAFVCILITSTFVILDLRFDIMNRKDRELSPQQIIYNLESIYGNTSREQLENTREWRLRWWRQILDYTFLGEYFWGGKGFGINLALSDGIHFRLPKDEPALRSPHNGHMTILARAGVPGFLLWIALLSTFGISLLRAYFRARRLGQELWARIDLWLLAYWVAFLVNMSFTVYLEGPQGGIWFWSLMGFGIAALELQRPIRAPARIATVVSRHPGTARSRRAPIPRGSELA